MEPRYQGKLPEGQGGDPFRNRLENRVSGDIRTKVYTLAGGLIGAYAGGQLALSTAEQLGLTQAIQNSTSLEDYVLKVVGTYLLTSQITLGGMVVGGAIPYFLEKKGYISQGSSALYNKAVVPGVKGLLKGGKIVAGKGRIVAGRGLSGIKKKGKAGFHYTANKLGDWKDAAETAVRVNANNALADRSNGEAFKVYNGVAQARSLRQLYEILKRTNGDVYGYHVTADRNDFSTWINDTLHDPVLARQLLGKGKDEAVKTLEGHIRLLERQAKAATAAGRAGRATRRRAGAAGRSSRNGAVGAYQWVRAHSNIGRSILRVGGTALVTGSAYAGMRLLLYMPEPLESIAATAVASLSAEIASNRLVLNNMARGSRFRWHAYNVISSMLIGTAAATLVHSNLENMALYYNQYIAHGLDMLSLIPRETISDLSKGLESLTDRLSVGGGTLLALKYIPLPIIKSLYRGMMGGPGNAAAQQQNTPAAGA